MDWWFNAEKQVKISQGAKKLANAWRTAKPSFLRRSLPRLAQSKQSLTWRPNWRQRSLNLSQGSLCSARHIWDLSTTSDSVTLFIFAHVFDSLSSWLQFQRGAFECEGYVSGFLNVRSVGRCWKPSRASLRQWHQICHSSMPRNNRPLQIGLLPAKTDHLFGIFYDPWSGNAVYWCIVCFCMRTPRKNPVWFWS